MKSFVFLLVLLASFSIVIAQGPNLECGEPCYSSLDCGSECPNCTVEHDNKELPAGECVYLTQEGGPEVPEFTTLGIGAAIVAGGAAYALLKRKK